MRTNTIYFSSGEPSVEVLRLSKDGIWANPDIPTDDAAKFVLNAIGHNIKVLVQKAVEDEREACAVAAEKESLRGLPEEQPEGEELLRACAQIAGGVLIADAIRARGQA